ncbi:MAG: carboxy terminal-processing peptidase, partial [Bacteroidia bacterium]
CANDVAKEIVKLEHDTIKGLIIDLRNNGGGSMQEAMNLAGIFVDEGPLFILKEKDKKPFIVKDINRGSLFKKPLVVMINETSASASELFSNIVKDYNIGLIVGQTSYGKGTAQNIIPLDTNALLTREPTSDFIKITNSKFYRLNCTTHQGNGVTPDVELPALPAYSIYKENKEKFHLASDTIVKKVVYTPNPPVNLNSIKEKSSQRVKASDDFKRFCLSADSVSMLLSATQKVALKYPDYKKYKSQTNTLFTSFENAAKSKDPAIDCVNNTFDKQLSEVNEITKEFNDRILESIKKDIFIAETFNIINDLIRQKK